MDTPRLEARRIERDVMKLKRSKHEITMDGDHDEFCVKFYGPKDTPYEQGVWKIQVELPHEYPFKSPSIGFLNKIYHPNVHGVSGKVSLDVIQETWEPHFDLIYIFEFFLPQLLTYPSTAEPLNVVNVEAGYLHSHRLEDYKDKVWDYIYKFANDDILTGSESSMISGIFHMSDL